MCVDCRRNSNLRPAKTFIFFIFFIFLGNTFQVETETEAILRELYEPLPLIMKPPFGLPKEYFIFIARIWIGGQVIIVVQKHVKASPTKASSSATLEQNLNHLINVPIWLLRFKISNCSIVNILMVSTTKIRSITSCIKKPIKRKIRILWGKTRDAPVSLCIKTSTAPIGLGDMIYESDNDTVNSALTRNIYIYIYKSIKINAHVRYNNLGRIRIVNEWLIGQTPSSSSAGNELWCWGSRGRHLFLHSDTQICLSQLTEWLSKCICSNTILHDPRSIKKWRNKIK